jgi:ankyrin repeat protein
MLLDEGADIHVQNKDGFNCLMMAAQEGRLEIARLLLNNDAHRTQHHGPRRHEEPKTDHGDTALSIAQREATHTHQYNKKHQEIADLILEYQKHHEVSILKQKAEDKKVGSVFKMDEL